MRAQFEVVYENGVFRPLAPLSAEFQEHQRLTVMVDDSAGSNHWLADADPTVSLEAVRRALAKTPGTIAEMIIDQRDER